MEVFAKNISKSSLFKLLFQSIGYGLFAFCFLMGIFSIFGFETVTWNGEAIKGFNGFLVSIPMGLFMAVLFTCFMWVLGILGLWINSYFKGVNIVFVEVVEQDKE